MIGKNKISVSLVLGSGDARGFAHIGAIHWLEENGYEIRLEGGTAEDVARFFSYFDPPVDIGSINLIVR